MAVPVGRRAAMLYLFEDYALDTDRRELLRADRPIAVQPQVFDVLAFLIANRGHVVSKDEIFEAVWDGRVVSESTLTSRINAARSAIGDSGEEQRLIRTASRKGFRFIGAVRETASSEAPAPPPPTVVLPARRWPRTASRRACRSSCSPSRTSAAIRITTPLSTA